MARRTSSFRFPGNYVTDNGAAVTNVRGVATIPPDIADGDWTTILMALNLEAIQPGTSVICSRPAGTFKPRKLIFVRQSGNSFSLPVESNAAVITGRQAVVAAVATATPTNPVICVRLEGEYQRNVLEALRTVGAIVPGTPPISTGDIGIRYAGKITYFSDSLMGTTSQVNASVDTDTAGQPPTIVGDTWNDHAGPFLAASPCPQKSTLETRHAIITVETSSGAANLKFPQIKIPVASKVQADVLQALTDFSNIPAAVCVDYYGENDRASWIA